MPRPKRRYGAVAEPARRTGREALIQRELARGVGTYDCPLFVIGQRQRFDMGPVGFDVRVVGAEHQTMGSEIQMRHYQRGLEECAGVEVELLHGMTERLAEPVADLQVGLRASVAPGGIFRLIQLLRWRLPFVVAPLQLRLMPCWWLPIMTHKQLPIFRTPLAIHQASHFINAHLEQKATAA